MTNFPTHTPTGKPIIHGKISTYTAYGCRCDSCKEASRLYRTGRAMRTYDEISNHGTWSAYVSGCRCEDCRAAQSLQSRARRYGLTPDGFEALRGEQGNACAICRQPFAGLSDTVVDHDGPTHTVRGLLCRKCNTGLGMLDDDPARAAGIIAYLASPELRDSIKRGQDAGYVELSMVRVFRHPATGQTVILGPDGQPA